MARLLDLLPLLGEELGVEPLLMQNVMSQLSWSRSSIRIHPGWLPLDRKTQDLIADDIS